jgi:hypothetical protein
MRLTLRTLVLACAAAAACHRPAPSPDFERARQAWTALVQERGDDAAEDARAGDVLALLGRVPADSLDAAAAQELRDRIERERQAREGERRRRAELVAKAGAPTEAPAVGAAPAPAPEAAVQPRAPEPIEGLAVGTKLDAFRAAHEGCVEPRGPVRLAGRDGGGAAGETWALKPGEPCATRFHHLAGQLVVFAGGALAGVSPATAVKRVDVRENVELGRLPDGGVGIRTDGGVVPPPAGSRVEVLDGGRP